MLVRTLNWKNGVPNGTAKDALLHRDRTFLYQDRPSVVLERYVMGLEDGRVLIRAGWVDSVWQPTI